MERFWTSGVDRFRQVAATHCGVRFTVEVPDEHDAVVRYGFDHALQWFGEYVIDDRVVETYDLITEGYDHARPLAGLLRCMSGVGVFDEADLEDALTLLIHREVEELPEHLRRIGEVTRNLKRAGDSPC